MRLAKQIEDIQDKNKGKKGIYFYNHHLSEYVFIETTKKYDKTINNPTNQPNAGKNLPYR